MKVKELTVTAVIPTAQYANLQPSVTVEVDGDYEEAKKEAMAHIAQFSQQYAEDGKVISDGSATTIKRKIMKPFIGQDDVLFDPVEHVYTDKDGNVFQSGSQFAKKFEHEFNTDVIVPVYAKKFSITEQEVRDFWRAKADASTTFGTALHQSLETYGKFKPLADELNTPEKPVLIGTHPTLLPIVEQFFTPERLAENAIYEPFVADTQGRRCGQIDRLVIVDREKKICDIEDYKTNADLYKQGQRKFLKAPYDTLPNQPVSIYTIQLNFYRAILEANGWTVRNLTLHHWDGVDGKWVTINLDKVDINA